MSKLEQILVLDPPNDLKFKGPFTDVITTNLKLKNPSERPVCFKVKTTAPRRYCVRPNSGLIEPGATVAISVMLQPFDYDPNEKNMEAVWKDAKPDDLMDSKLRCVFELPTENAKVNDTESSKAAPVLNSSKGDAPAATPKPSSLSLDDSEMRKLAEEYKKLQAEAGKLVDENRQLKHDGLRMRKAPRSDSAASSMGATTTKDHSSASLPSLLVVIAAIFIGFFLGKFIL